MCGITGYWARRGDPAPWLKDLAGSVQSLKQRGPDDSGVWVRNGGRVALGHTRLSILDLSPLGHQPMRTADGSLSMVFNGEVYNFAQVRAELETLGHRFRSSGDSEVVLAAFEQWGMEAVKRFIGMFAIAIWNERERRLHLVRDRMGVKPLYYAWNGNNFWFGSELKALRAFQAWPAEIDRDALGEYLQYGYVSAPRSIYRGVHKLLPGHWLELGEVGEPVAHRYWSPLPTEKPFEDSEQELERHLEFLLVDSFRYRTVSDVPVGVFLSGGIDSSAVAAILQRYGGGRVHTFTIGFDDPRFNEAGHAAAVARHLGTEHTQQIVTAKDMEQVLLHWADLFDEPFGDSSGVPTYLVSKLARQHVKVALSADGGDELFSGYSHYRIVAERERELARIPAALRAAIGGAIGALGPSRMQALADGLPMPASMRHSLRRNLIERLDKLRVMFPELDRALMYDLAMSSWTPWEISPLLGGYDAGREPAGLGAESFADQMARCDLRHFLPDDILVKVDRTTMASGLEGREPFLDHRLVEFAARLPLELRNGPLGPKHLLRKILYKYVPRELLERPKQGFGIPLASWLRGELAPLVHEYLSPRRIREQGLFDPALVTRAVRNFREGGPGNDRLDMQKLWYLISFQLWHERWMTGLEHHDEGEPHARVVCH
ncbi:MAG TPA: asparagine synthase (glutamine-hydrolyzing) [Usitatibacter sp.]|nr:asparagine synthase (glutamine-hydrolyzing) [Usitatibacter sp.]